MKKAVLFLFLSLLLTSCKENGKEQPNSLQLSDGTSSSLTIYADQTNKPNSISFQATAAWRAVVEPLSTERDKSATIDWLKLSADQGEAGFNSISLELSINSTAKPRQALIKISCQASTIVITVSQQCVTDKGDSMAVVKIEDAAFRAYLLKNFDTNVSGEMEIAEMAAIEQIYIVDPAISSMGGIEYCVNLHTAIIEESPITVFDFSKSQHFIDCSIDRPVAKKIKLIAPSLSALSLRSVAADQEIDLSACSQIEKFTFYKSNIDLVDLSKFPNVQYIITQNLKVDKLDLSTFATLKGFSMYEVTVGELIISNHDLEVFAFENSSTPSIDLSSTQVTFEGLSIRGYNDFEYLNLGSIPFALAEDNKPQLALQCLGKSAITIESQYLRSLSIDESVIEKLDLVGCKALEQLYLVDNSKMSTQIAKPLIDVLTLKAGSQLKRLALNWTRFGELDLTATTGVEGMVVDGHRAENLKLTGADQLVSIEFLNSAYAKRVDISNSTALQTLNSSYMEALQSLDVSACTALQEANVNYCKGLDLFKLSGCSSLDKLFCTMNGIKQLQLDGCTKLQQLWCSANEIVTLDLSTCKIFNDSYIVPGFYPLQCKMSSLKTLYLKTGDKINGINVYRNPLYIDAATNIEYK